MRETESSRTWPWFLLALLWVVALLNYLDRQVIFSIFPVLQNELHASSLELGLTSTIFLFTYALFSPFAGYIADRFGRGRVIIVSLIVWSLSCLIASHVHTMLGLLGTRAGMGISEAFYIPSALALLVEAHGEKSKSLATGIHQSGCYAGIILGGTLGGMAGDSFGWRPLFAGLGLIGVAYAAILWTALHMHKRSEHVGKAEWLDVTPLLRNFKLKIFTFVFVAFSISSWILYTWLPLYLYQRFNISLTAAGFEATFWIQSACFGGALVGGYLADRPSRNPARRRVYAQMIGLSLACPFLILLSHSTSESLVIVALVSIGLGRGCFDASTAPILEKMIDPRLFSTGYGVLNCVGTLVGGVGAFLGGWMRQRQNFSVIFDVAGVGMALGVLGLGFLLRIQSKDLSAASRAVPGPLAAEIESIP